MTSEERKQQSIEMLKSNNIPFIEWLPTIERASDITMRSKEEVAKRFVTCYFTLQVTCDLLAKRISAKISRRAFWEKLEHFNLVDSLTSNELIIFEGIPRIFGMFKKNPNRQELNNMFWKHEAFWILFWALGFINKLGFPSKKRESSDYNAIHKIMRKCDSLEDFLKQGNLRSIDEILDEADLIYRYHWACADRGDEKVVPTKLNRDVVLERHRAFNWLIGKNTDNEDWDNVTTNT